MRTLIKRVAAITLDSTGSFFPETNIVLMDGIISSIGVEPDGIVPDQIIDGKGLVAMPALFNAHTHTAMTLERGWAEDLSFPRWLNEKIWVAESALTEEDVYWGAALAAAEMIRAGTVGFADHYFWMDQVARVVEETGMKALLAWCHFGRSPEQEIGKQSFQENCAFVRRWGGAAGGRIHTTLGPHSPYMVPASILEKFAEEAHRLGVGVHLHVSESREQVEKSVSGLGLTPIGLLDHLGLLDLPQPALLAHCNILLENDMAILASKKAWIAHTPKTYQKLAMEMPPLIEMLAQGVRVAFGTDGPASNSDINLFEVMRIAGLFQKYIHHDPEILPIDQIMRMATQMPAQALGFPSSGVLAPGRAADLILLDTNGPHWIPRHDLRAGIVYASHPCDVTYVFSDGRLIYQKGEYLSLDIDRIRFEAEKRAFRMVGGTITSMRTYSA